MGAFYRLSVKATVPQHNFRPSYFFFFSFPLLLLLLLCLCKLLISATPARKITIFRCCFFSSLCKGVSFLQVFFVLVIFFFCHRSTSLMRDFIFITKASAQLFKRTPPLYIEIFLWFVFGSSFLNFITLVYQELLDKIIRIIRIIKLGADFSLNLISCYQQFYKVVFFFTCLTHLPNI